MKCSKMQKLMSPYLDNELSEGKKKELEDHMKVCGKCRAEMEEMQALSRLFVNADKFEAPFGFRTRVTAGVSAPQTRRQPSIPVFLRLAEAVIVLVVVTAGIMSGTFVVTGLMPEKAGNAMASLHLDVFSSAPPDTLGGAYLAMTEVRDEK
jgi:anti-sigma factor RsiW